jgi:hypothetical protein
VQPDATRRSRIVPVLQRDLLAESGQDDIDKSMRELLHDLASGFRISLSLQLTSQRHNDVPYIDRNLSPDHPQEGCAVRHPPDVLIAISYTLVTRLD